MDAPTVADIIVMLEKMPQDMQVVFFSGTDKDCNNWYDVVTDAVVGELKRFPKIQQLSDPKNTREGAQFVRRVILFGN